MKTSSPVSPLCSSIRRASLISLAMIAGNSGVSAATVYWTGSTAGTWGTTSYWSTDGVTVTNPASAPDGTSDVVLNMTGVNAAETITLAGNAAVNSLTINNTSTTSFAGSAYHLSLGSGGITIAAGAGSVSFSGIKLSVVATQSWTNNSSNTVTLNSSGVSYADSTVTTPVTLTLAGAGGWSFSHTNYFVDNSSTGTLALVIDTTSNAKITNAQSYSGGTVIKGYLRPENVGALGTGKVTLDTSSGSPTLSSNFSGTMLNNFVVGDGTGTATLTTVNASSPTYSGTFTLNNTTNALAVVGYAGATITISGRITGVGGIAKTTNNSALVLSGSNDFQGGLTLSTGTVQLWSSYALGTGTLTINGGTIGNTSGSDVKLLTNNTQVWNGNFTFSGTNNLNMGTGSVSLGTAAGTSRQVTVNANTLTVGGGISNGTTATALVKTGTGTLVLAGANTYTGLTTVNQGTLQLGDGSTGTLAGTGVAVTTSTATFNVNMGANAIYSGTINNAGSVSAVSSNVNTLAGVISGTGAFNQSGSGRTVLSATNTYTGATSITAGKLDVNGAIAAGSTVTVTSGTLGGSGSVGGNVNVTAGSIAGSGLRISGSASFDGASTLSGTNTINGINIASGVLSLSGSTASAVRVGSGATLSSANGQIGGNVDVLGTLSGSTKISGALTLTSGAVLSLQLGSIISYDSLDVSGLVTLTGATLDLTLGNIEAGNVFTLISSDSAITTTFSNVFVSGSSVNWTSADTFTVGTISYELSYNSGASNDVTLTALAVPEPATWAMLISGFGCLLGLQRFRRNF